MEWYGTKEYRPEIETNLGQQSRVDESLLDKDVETNLGQQSAVDESLLDKEFDPF